MPHVDEINQNGRTTEVTGPQVTVLFGDSILQREASASYKFYREMRKDPTISLGRRALVSSVVRGDWSYSVRDGESDELADELRGTFEPMRTAILRSALRGLIDFGWIPFEKVWRLDEGQVRLAKLKPLLQDLTDILIDEATGNYAGLRQRDVLGNEIFLVPEQTLLLSINVEGSNWYGEGLLESARRDYNDWNNANNGASRYDRKVAGNQIWINHPQGKDPRTGEKYAATAAKIAAGLESAGIVTTPKALKKRPSDKDNWDESWEIKGVDTKGSLQPAFVDRLKYIDGRLIRALGFPERAILEGQFGTKAESEIHVKFVINFMEELEGDIVQAINWHVANMQLRFNHGPEADGAAFIERSEISTAQRELLADLLKTIMGSQFGQAETIDNTNVRTILERLGIPLADLEDLPGGSRNAT